MAISPFIAAINQIVDEKNLPREVVVEAIESALAAAYRKDYGHAHQIIRVKLDPDGKEPNRVFRVWKVVKKGEVTNPENEMELREAKKLDKKVKVDGEVNQELEYKEDFGRIAAQTAKQVIIQRLQEAERAMLYKEFKEKEGQLLTGTVQQIEGENIIVSLGKINALMSAAERIPGERYYLGQRLRVYVAGVEETNRGPRIIVSRANPNLIAGLFALEVPEIAAGTVTIEDITREPGSRTKIAVAAHQEGLDPIGSCVGQRGVRVQAVLAEVGDEKIDIIEYSPDVKSYIANALSPAKVQKVTLNKKEKKAAVLAAEDQLSLAIGRNGQNVRLASKLVGYSIDIVRKDKKGVRSKEKEVRIKD